MKIRVQQDILQRHISIAQRAVSSRTTMQVLEGILFEAKDGRLKLSSSDLEISVETILPCTVEEEGKAMIPSSLIGNIVRKLPNSEVYIGREGDKVTVKCERSLFNLSSFDPAEFPEFPQKNGDSVITFKNVSLQAAIRETIFAVSTDEMRLALTGVLTESTEEGVRFVALDGYRLATRLIAGIPNQNQSIIIPSRSLGELTRILDPEGETRMSMVPGYVIFDLGTTQLYSRLIEKKYINYREILTQDFNREAVCDRQALQHAIERAQLLAQEERANLIKLHLEEDVMEITSNTEIGNVFEQVAIDYQGEPLDIAFNARYLLDGIKNISESRIRMTFSGSLSPCIMHPESDSSIYTYLVLPVRLAR